MNSLLFRVMRRLRYEYLVRYENPATLKTKQGIFRVPLGIKDPISWELFLFGEFELALMGEAMEIIRKLSGRPKGKGTVLDIGANNGITSIGMLVTGELDSAIAVEPEPVNFGRLRENVTLNGLDDRILQIQCALSDRKGELVFELSDINYGDHRVRPANQADGVRDLWKESERSLINVPAETLDTMILGLPNRFTDDIAVVWIDVQGHEGHVFEGAREFLAQGIPVVSEVWPYAIMRSGMTLDAFSTLVNEIWDSFWIRRRGRFVRYPALAFRALLDELGTGREYENVIFTRG
jgi:FkbM family methyltransferase